MTGKADAAEPTQQELWDQEIAASGVTSDAVTFETKQNDVVAPAVEAAKPQPTPDATAPAADPYAGLHPAIRKQLEDQAGLFDRIRRTEGHIGGLTSELKRTKDELAAAKAAAQQVREAPTAAAVAAAQKSTEKWDQLKTDFPEWADALEERLGTQAQPDFEGLRSRIQEELSEKLRPQLRDELKAEIASETEGRLVGIAHRGWRNTVNTPEFAAWLGGQPANVKALAESSVAEDAIELLDNFKAQQSQQADAGRIASSRKQRLQEAASAARGTSGNSTPIKSTADMSEKELWDFYAKHPQHLESRR